MAEGSIREATLLPCSRGSSAVPPPWGLYGGCPAAANDAYVERADGTIVMLPGKFDHFPIAPGDMFVMRTGGGGWGHPYKRDPEQVRRDVACGLLTIAQARDLYGVALTGRPPRVDWAATQRLRADPPARNNWIDRGVPQASPGPNTYRELEEPPVPWPVSGRLG
jgi:N-methylhydantoinase B